MVVTNRKRETAIVIRHDGKQVSIVTMGASSLSAVTMTEKAFRADWSELAYSLEVALERFLRHAARHGATKQAMHGLLKLQARDQFMVGSLF